MDQSGEFGNNASDAMQVAIKVGLRAIPPNSPIIAQAHRQCHDIVIASIRRSCVTNSSNCEVMGGKTIITTVNVRNRPIFTLRNGGVRIDKHAWSG